MWGAGRSGRTHRRPRSRGRGGAGGAGGGRGRNGTPVQRLCPSQPLCPGREFPPIGVLFAAYARELRCPRACDCMREGGAGRGRDGATTRPAGRAARRCRHGTPGRGGLRRPRDEGGSPLVGRPRRRRLDGGSRRLDPAPGPAVGTGRRTAPHAVGLTCVITRFVRAMRNGTWRSLVAHLTGGQGVAGSNPVVPTHMSRK